jgi:hypothetical protein
MRDWTTMSASAFYTDGVQLDLLAEIEGDGYGTIAIDEIDTEDPQQAEVVEPAEREDGALFGLAISDEPTDDALFSVVAA